MNNEIHRVLSLLEEGKISAQEATELIAALGSAKQTMGSAGSDEGPGAGRSGSAEGSREGGPDIIQIIGRALRRMARRQTRATWWRYYAFTDQHSRSRTPWRTSLDARLRMPRRDDGSPWATSRPGPLITQPRLPSPNSLRILPQPGSPQLKPMPSTTTAEPEPAA